MDEHRIAVAGIAAKVRSFFDRKEAFRIYHGGTNSTRAMNFQRDKIIDTSQLDNVIRIDPLQRKALVEPNVSMAKLVNATLAFGCIPQVVMELPAITVGGGFAGTSGESSSFKYGFFENTISLIEIVLANGEVTTASPTANPDLFEGAAGTFGTFGVITLLEVQLILAKPFVLLEYIPTHSVTEIVEKLESATENSDTTDFVDGILFSSNRGVVMTGQLSGTVPEGTNIVRFTRPNDQWFYQDAEKRLEGEANSRFSIAIPIVDYLFRYDRGAFWTGKYAFQYFVTPFNRITRYLLDSFMRAKVMYHAFHESGLAERYIVQDIGFPSSTVGDFISYLDQTFGFYPLWLCPLRKGHGYPMHARAVSAAGNKKLNNEVPINVGVWGPGPENPLEFIAANRHIEQKTKELFGVKCLYARAYYTEDEFWELYDRKWYEALRVKYHADSLPNVYEKVKTEWRWDRSKPVGMWRNWPLNQLPALWDVWPTAGLYGVVKAALALYSPYFQDYVFARR